MTIFDFAKGLDGREYRNEITPLEEQRAKELGFVIVFGYSDDNTEFRGAYREEIECYDGGRVYEDGDKYIDAVWCEGEYCWTYNTNIPHATFDIYEDNEKYCKGIVFEKCECYTMTTEKLKTAVSNMNSYLEECHNDEDTITLTVKVLKSVKENYEELINCRAEIERLERHTEMYHELRADAINEFADRLKWELAHIVTNVTDMREVVDNLVKEMVGDT